MVEAGDRGRAALEARDWVAAVAAFEQAAAESAGPGDWEGLAVARRWSGDLGGAIVVRERAYHLYRAMPDDESAARVAAFLALDVLEGRGNTALAAGWLARARDLLPASLCAGSLARFTDSFGSVQRSYRTTSLSRMRVSTPLGRFGASGEN
jgi:hypothetical protein